ncbi:MAG: DNA recombination protein RmuC [Candidatus Endonucleobacter sp. (ex Gigantidas childressi)]|nr:DNA recombination protein RmuC [Candidatus Endonucleobacter sp. (ex Gigantidas childressi)]
MSLINIAVAVTTAFVAVILTSFFNRQQSLRNRERLELNLGQCNDQLAKSEQVEAGLNNELRIIRDERQELLIENKRFEVSLAGIEERRSESANELLELKNRIMEYEHNFQRSCQIEGQAKEQSVHLVHLQTEKSELLDKLESERSARTKAEKDSQELKARLEEQQNHNQMAIKQLNENKDALKQEFNNIANEIFEAKAKTFSDQHKDRLEGTLKPFRDQLADFKNKVEEARKDDHAGRAALKQQLEMLHTLNQKITDEASNLTKALKGDKKLQGTWGEIQVEKILESSGLIKGREYEREPNFKDNEGQNKRPDFVVYLPEGKHLIIDSKVSLVDYIDYVNANVDAIREKALSRHINSIRTHIKELSKKGYSKLPSIQSPDFVFMFMPIEPAFMVAFQHDQQLFSDAFEQRIVVVAPTTLLATLRTVANSWSIERQNTNARALADRAGSVYDKLRVFVDKMEKLDSQLAMARDTYDDAMNTLRQGRGNLVSQANEFMNLGVRVKKEFSQQTLGAADLRPEGTLE